MRELTPKLRAFVDLACAAQGAYEVEDLLLRVCRSIAETFGFERASIAEYAEERGEVVPLVTYGLAGDDAAEPRALADLPLLERALQTREIVFVPDAAATDDIPSGLVEAFGVTSLVAVPLLAGGGCFGFLAADRGGSAFELDEEDLALLGALGALVAVFLEKAVAHESLRRVDELRSNFVALASHELRTPAGIVHGIASTLQLRGPELREDQVLELRRMLYEQTERLRRLVDQLLDLSRLEASGIAIQQQPIAVRSRVQDVVAMVAGERSGELRLEIEPKLQAVTDPAAFDRIVSNLIVNALRHGQMPITVAAAQPDRHFRLSVEDRGEGVSPEFEAKLFERFTRSETSHARRIEGAGLGLAIARSYAHAQGGELLYSAAEPHGARFELVLPAFHPERE